MIDAKKERKQEIKPASQPRSGLLLIKKNANIEPRSAAEGKLSVVTRVKATTTTTTTRGRRRRRLATTTITLALTLTLDFLHCIVSAPTLTLTLTPPRPPRPAVKVSISYFTRPLLLRIPTPYGSRPGHWPLVPLSPLLPLIDCIDEQLGIIPV